MIHWFIILKLLVPAPFVTLIGEFQVYQTVFMDKALLILPRINTIPVRRCNYCNFTCHCSKDIAWSHMIIAVTVLPNHSIYWSFDFYMNGYYFTYFEKFYSVNVKHFLCFLYISCGWYHDKCMDYWLCIIGYSRVIMCFHVLPKQCL